ncbi:MAG: 4-(cytidine 5'-diphospho)-2-C-methyl-D-erythritol kinase [Ruminococcaceae bacterium]|nr:4-(cytidine 5'-diphospho)-2-C-methyl-D-erythritol kinase [Oscillospiraceae bacterium]
MIKNIICPAKINLFLEITGRREDGYHTLDTLMHTVSLADTLTIDITRGEENIKLAANGSTPIPTDERNIAYRAAQKYISSFEIKGYDVSVIIDKKIPVSAGLGGGSTDGAGVLRALESVFNVGDKETLDKIALSIGADVPFCMYGGCMRAKGIGEILSPVSEIPKDMFIVIAKGELGVNTAKAYSDIDKLPDYTKKSADEMVKRIENKDKSFTDLLFNRFEDSVLIDIPEIRLIKEELLRFGALSSLMSGSGSAVYAFFEDEKNASAACESLIRRGIFACVTSAFGKADF